jgi:hypothetical protein
MRIRQCYRRSRATLLSFTLLLLLMFGAMTFAQTEPTQPTLIYKIGIGTTGLTGDVASSVDAVGNTYLAGSKTTNQGPECADVIVQKVDASGANVIYRLTISNCGFVGKLASDRDGYAYVLYNSSITRISPDGSEIINAWAWAGGANDIVVSPRNQLFIAGTWNNDAYAAKLDLASGNLVWMTSFGGNANDFANGLAVDSIDNVFVTGRTQSTDFPAISAAQDTLQGSSDGFVVKIDPTGSFLMYSTYIGGANFDEAAKPAVDDVGNCYVTGGTNSPDFPTVNALQANLNGSADPFNPTADAFLTKISADGSSFLYSTFLGGSGSEQARGITVDSLHNAYVTGTTSSFDFPLFRAMQTTFEGNWQAFLSKINSNGSALIYSTYESGGPNQFYQGYNLHADSSNNIYLTIQTHGYQGGGENVQLSKFAANAPPLASAGTDQMVQATSPTTTNVTLDGSGSMDPENDPLTYIWKNETGNTIGTTAQVVLALPAGQYTFELSVADTSGAKSTDSVHLIVRDVPSITITSPTQTNYLVDENLIASYSCSDPGGSAVVACTGSVPNATAISTSTAGARTFTVTATNALGNLASSSINYAVTYKIFLMYNSGSALNPKSKPQIKIQLENANSVSRSSSTLAVTAMRVTPRNTQNVTVKVLSGNFMFDPNLNFQGAAAGGGYIYDLDASGISTGTYDLVFSVAGDPVQHVAPFAMK